MFVWNSNFVPLNPSHRSELSTDGDSTISSFYSMLGGEGWSGGHRRAIPKLSHRDASHALNDHTRRSQAVAIGPRTADGRVQVASTYGAVHLAGSHPHAQGRVRFDCIPR